MRHFMQLASMPTPAVGDHLRARRNRSTMPSGSSIATWRGQQRTRPRRTYEAPEGGQESDGSDCGGQDQRVERDGTERFDEHWANAALESRVSCSAFMRALASSSCARNQRDPTGDEKASETGLTLGMSPPACCLTVRGAVVPEPTPPVGAESTGRGELMLARAIGLKPRRGRRGTYRGQRAPSTCP